MNGRRVAAAVIAVIGLGFLLTGFGYHVQASARRPEPAERFTFPANWRIAVSAPRGGSYQAQQTATPGTAERLAYGNTVKRTFTAASDAFTFTFQAQAGDVITLTMVADRGESVDPALVLIGPDGNPVARNDDSFDANFGVVNARLVNFPIEVSGTYTIQAIRSTNANGSFTLTLRGARSRRNENSLDYGDSSQGTISTSVVRVNYQFQATAGDVISIVVQRTGTSRLIPYIVLADADGKTLITTNTAERTAGTARITQYPIRADGVYTIVVSRAGEQRGASSGAFRLNLTRDASYSVVKYGDTISGSIGQARPENRYLFFATEGDIVTITMARKTGNLDALLSLLGAGGKQIATNDNAAGQGLRTGDSQIRRFEIPETAGYIIVTGRRGKERGASSGDFGLSVELIEAGEQE